MSDTTPADLAVHGDLALPDGTLLRGGWMSVRGGAIVAVSGEPLPARQVVDAREKLVLPGVVDAHVHARSSLDEGIEAATRAAAAGGVTTIVDMPFDAPGRPIRTVEALRAKAGDVDAEACVDVALYATFAPQGGLEHIAPLAAAGACGFKASVYGVDPARFPRIPDDQIVAAFAEIARTGLPVALHQENQEIVDAAVRHARLGGDTNGGAHARSRPPVAETEAAGRLLEFAYWTGVHLHMVHGTVPRTFDQIGWHRTGGTTATGETCVQYLTLSAAELDRQGARVKCNPPLRGEADVAMLWEYLATGRIDIVTSDHSPYALAAKAGTIFDAAAGMPGVETLLPVLYDAGVVTGRLTISRLVTVLCSEPARIFGLERKGSLSIGHDADFVVFDPLATYALNETDLHYAVGWSPYHGRPMTGRVDATYLRGRRVYRAGDDVVGGYGRFVRPARTDVPGSPSAL